MQYIILDMEWNQPWPGSYSAQKRLPTAIRGEIIQIGAVRMLDDQTVSDEFQILIRPKYYKKLNRKVSSLTGIKDAQLKDAGFPFPEAIEQFRAWCGEDCIFLTWGFDDITILKENLALHGLETGWVSRWYNAQMIFNAQTDGSTSQKALKTAMELMEIEPSRAAHDALGDAYHTALVCRKLDLAAGVESYEAAVRAHENGFHGAQVPGCLKRSVRHGLPDKAQALLTIAQEESACPLCGGRLCVGRWYAQPGRRFLALASCPEDGELYFRLRLSGEEDGTLKAALLVYEPNEQLESSYQALAQRPRARRRRRGRKPAQNPAQNG